MLEIADALVSGFYQVFTWPTFSLMLVGIAVGFIVGLLPGLGGPATMALMLPFTFQMKAVEAFAFLLGMAAVTGTTGDITSILFGVPGESTAAATIVDGHSMAKKGEAGRALGAALMSSLVGAVFGALFLALAIPVVRPLVLTFGSPEFFMLALSGVSFVAFLSGGALLKGLVSGGMGFFLGTIGLDPISGIQRYTFGQLFLWDGIGLVPVTLGLFAIPEIIDLAVLGTSIAQQQVGKLGGVMQGVKDTFRHFWLVIRCSALGAYIGIIPGMGGSVGQWVSYAHAMQSSPHKERFGHGAVEGVLGPGAANNSTIGGALIPTIAFGVPGSVIMTILLGAFIVQGIVPGPDMLIPEPKGHLALTFSFVWVIVVANLLTVAVCFFFLNQLAKVTQIRASLLIPFILFLTYVGAFAEKNIFEDMTIMVIFGALGWIMVQLDWPRPPLLLGLVLAPLMENRLFLSADIYGIAWLRRPGVLLLFALTLIGIFYPMLRERRKKTKSDTRSTKPSLVAQDEGGAERSSLGMLFSLSVVAVLAWALWESKEFGFHAGLFPWATGFPVLVLAISQLATELTGKGRTRGIASAPEARPELATSLVYRRTASISGWIIGFFLLIWLFGFSVAVPLATLLYLKVAGREKWLITLILTAVAWSFFFGLFDRGLHMPFPEGQFFLWFGWFLR